MEHAFPPYFRTFRLPSSAQASEERTVTRMHRALPAYRTCSVRNSKAKIGQHPFRPSRCFVHHSYFSKCRKFAESRIVKVCERSKSVLQCVPTERCLNSVHRSLESCWITHATTPHAPKPSWKLGSLLVVSGCSQTVFAQIWRVRQIKAAGGLRDLTNQKIRNLGLLNQSEFGGHKSAYLSKRRNI